MAARVWPVDAVTGSPSYTGRALRQTSVSPFVAMGSTGRPLGGISGVRPGTPSTIVSTTSTTWTVTPFAGVIDGEAAAIAGVYAYSFDTNQTGSVTAAAGSARIDRLDVQVSDPAESDGSSNPGVAIVYTAGTPGSGVAASAPARSHPLALINVPASGGGSPTVTWNAVYFAGAGGLIPVLSQAARDALFAYEGLAVWRLDTHVAETYNGSAWQLISANNLLMKPTSVTATGGSATISNYGRVDVTSATALTLNGVFTSQFTDYEIFMDITCSSAAQLKMVVTASGAASGVAYYDEIMYANVTATAAAQDLNAGSWTLTAASGAAHKTYVDLSWPQAARQTTMYCRSSDFVNVTGGAVIATSVAGYHNNSSSFDGIQIVPTAGSISGSIRVVGRNNG